MYKIPIPITAWLGALVKVAYDRELSISEHRVKPADILHNSSIILGKQIIHILPEGSAILNPEKKAFCLDASTSSIELPIQINQTTPISIELQRFDLLTDEVETIVIGSKEAKQLKKHADIGFQKTDTNTPRTLLYSVSKTGLYQLHRVIDATKLEVRRRSFDVAVVQCPKASISAETVNRCTGQLSNVSLQVAGVPPFKVKYSKTVNHKQFSSIVQNVQPRGDFGHISADGEDSGIISDPKKPHMGWTSSTTESFDINESLHQNGTHSYTIEEVEDGLGNKVIYDSTNPKDVRAPQVQGLTVHNRPRVSLFGCSSDRLIPVPKDFVTNLPVRVQPAEILHSSDWPLKLKYSFSSEAEEDSTPSEEHVHEMTNDRSGPRINKAGRYNLDSIDSQYCHGEIEEPSSCILFNPPEPNLTMESESVFDKCAGNPIGMIVNLDFTGTPPFKVRYTVAHKGVARPVVSEFPGMRGKIELLEREAGSFTYTITEIKDSVYDPVSLRDRDLVLKQEIKPPAAAAFHGANRGVINACLGTSASFQVEFSGQGPWDLDYELVHSGKRSKQKVHSEEELYTINVPPLMEGGKYSIILTGVQDTSRCRTTLQEERQIEVRPEQPRAAFGDIEGKRSILALDGKSLKLPLRLKGTPPWTIKVRNQDDDSNPAEKVFRDANSVYSVDRPGTYEIVSVHDSCPGLIDPKANTFQVSWIPRPTLSVRDSDIEAKGYQDLRKPAVCQGDEAVLALSLQGTPPFHLKYQQKFEPVKGPSAISNKAGVFAGSNALINLDTSKAGEYSYVFSELGDDRYSHDKKVFKPTVVKQQVYAPPSAKFKEAGKTYGYCKDDPSFTPSVEAETENIPISFTGTPPFSIEIAVTHHGVSTRPEVFRQKDISTNTYSWPLSRASLDLGTHSVSIRSVKDARGCETRFDSDPSSVRIFVSSPPTIIPLESQENYCVGEHVSFSLSGQAPFDVFYMFQNRERKARVSGSEFKRLAESPGDFVITGVSDSAMGNSKCRARKDIKKTIHPYPTVEIGRGKTVISDIHEGGEVDILFTFTGTPPFEFT